MAFSIINWLKDQADIRTLQAIKNAVDKRVDYMDNQTNEWRYVPVFSKGLGDCQVFTECYRLDAIRAGFTDAQRHVFKLPDGTHHAVCVVNGKWIMDNRRQLIYT